MNPLFAERLGRQGLSAALPSIDAAMERLLAVQSQDLLGAMWALGLRCGSTLAEVIGAYDRGEILRTHVMRPTWHFVRPSDLGWLMQTTAHRVHRLSAPVYARNAIDAALRGRATEVMARALEGGVFLTRDELTPELTSVDLDRGSGGVRVWGRLGPNSLRTEGVRRNEPQETRNLTAQRR